MCLIKCFDNIIVIYDEKCRKNSDENVLAGNHI